VRLSYCTARQPPRLVLVRARRSTLWEHIWQVLLSMKGYCRVPNHDRRVQATAMSPVMTGGSRLLPCPQSCQAGPGCCHVPSHDRRVQATAVSPVMISGSRLLPCPQSSTQLDPLVG